MMNKALFISGLCVFLFSACSGQQKNAATPSANEAQLPAFPGAEGFGKYTTGGRAGKVIIVSSLEDSGPGSLREAINEKGPRIVVFSISGTIVLESKLAIRNGDLTIAGQTAPGDGICIKNYTTHVLADNVIIRYIRFRLGDEKKQQDDAINGTGGYKNIIIDHCSMSWSVDECASFYRNRQFTLQWCIVAQSLSHSAHDKGNHGYGGIWGGSGASYHHNLIACHTSRNPRFSGSSSTPNAADELVDFRNNVIYNWKGNSIYGGERGRYNMVNNYYKPGPATSAKRAARIVNPTAPYGKFYVYGNYIEGNQKISNDNWAGGIQPEDPDSVSAVMQGDSFMVEMIAPQSATEAFEKVLQDAGASLQRDAIDKMVVNDTRTGKASAGKDRDGIIDSQSDVGGWPELKSTPAPADSDKDGMPDQWEKKNGLNPTSPADAPGHTLDKTYTNIEIYINSLVK